MPWNTSSFASGQSMYLADPPELHLGQWCLFLCLTVLQFDQWLWEPNSWDFFRGLVVLYISDYWNVFCSLSSLLFWTKWTCTLFQHFPKRCICPQHNGQHPQRDEWSAGSLAVLLSCHPDQPSFGWSPLQSGFDTPGMCTILLLYVHVTFSDSTWCIYSETTCDDRKVKGSYIVHIGVLHMADRYGDECCGEIERYADVTRYGSHHLKIYVTGVQRFWYVTGLWKHSWSYCFIQYCPESEAWFVWCLLWIGTLPAGGYFDVMKMNKTGFFDKFLWG